MRRVLHKKNGASAHQKNVGMYLKKNQGRTQQKNLDEQLTGKPKRVLNRINLGE